MKTAHDVLREKLLRQAGIKVLEPWWKDFVPKKIFATLQDIEVNVKRKWCPKFFCLMKTRLAMGFLRYEFSAKKKGQFDYIEALETKLRLYKETGNTEFLVDVGNYAMLEFKEGQHPNWHYYGTDDVGHANAKS